MKIEKIVPVPVPPPPVFVLTLSEEEAKFLRDVFGSTSDDVTRTLCRSGLYDLGYNQKDSEAEVQRANTRFYEKLESILKHRHVNPRTVPAVNLFKETK